MDIKPIATDSGHWYIPNADYTAECFYTVPKVKGGDRPAHKGDARKVGAVPGVTTITKCWKNFHLTQWLINRALEFGYASNALPDLSALKEAYEIEASKPADRGKDVHGIIERGLKGEDLTVEDRLIWATFDRGMTQAGYSLDGDFAERAFASKEHGYGCRLDAMADASEFRVVVDFKTLESVEKKRDPYGTEMMQIAANQRLLSLHLGGKVDAASLIYVSPSGEIIRTCIYNTVDLIPWLRKFDALLACWKVMEDM